VGSNEDVSHQTAVNSDESFDRRGTRPAISITGNRAGITCNRRVARE
jgi:hypothetical protein